MNSGVKVNVEVWDIEGAKVKSKKPRIKVEKVTVRDYHGRFHGVTNVVGTIRGIV